MDKERRKDYGYRMVHVLAVCRGVIKELRYNYVPSDFIVRRHFADYIGFGRPDEWEIVTQNRQYSFSEITEK